MKKNKKVNIKDLEKVSGGVKSKIIDSLGSRATADGRAYSYAKGGYDQYNKGVSIGVGHGSSN